MGSADGRDYRRSARDRGRRRMERAERGGWRGQKLVSNEEEMTSQSDHYSNAGECEDLNAPTLQHTMGRRDAQNITVTISLFNNNHLNEIYFGAKPNISLILSNNNSHSILEDYNYARLLPLNQPKGC